jgi:hypothetical protein
MWAFAQRANPTPYNHPMPLDLKRYQQEGDDLPQHPLLKRYLPRLPQTHCHYQFEVLGYVGHARTRPPPRLQFHLSTVILCGYIFSNQMIGWSSELLSQK